MKGRSIILDQIVRQLHVHEVQVLNVVGQPATLEEVFTHFTASEQQPTAPDSEA